ncbi:MAG: hypothetical protein IJ733_18045 [Lachnospiraceae bacterium]|nr:hypothetical protein [Lachnospiraceae bacterium]
MGKFGKYYVPFLYATNGQPYLKQIATKSGIWELDVRGGRAPRALSGWKSPEGKTEVLLSMATGDGGIIVTSQAKTA